MTLPDPYSEDSRQRLYKFLSSLGLIVIPGFLSEEECACVRLEMDRGPTASFYSPDMAKNALLHEVPPETCRKLDNLIMRVKPQIEKQAGKTLKRSEPLRFQTYGPGGYILPHVDRREKTDSPHAIRMREMVAIVHLSTESSQNSPGAHLGGALVFYGLVPGKAAQNRGFALPAQAGLLVAFKPDIVHEIRPVLAGTRYNFNVMFSFEESGI